MNAVNVEVVSRVGALLGEGPIWDARAECLWWVDIIGKALHRFEPGPEAANRETRWTLDCEPGAVAPCTRPGDGVMLVTPEGYLRFHPGSGQKALLAEVERDIAATRMNDGKCDSQGRFWAGTMAHDESAGAGGFYVLDEGDGVRQVLRDVGISNGLGWSPDDALMYYIDSQTRAVDVFDFDADAGSLANRRHLVEVPEPEGIPDGLCVDRDGFVWVALWSGSAVHRYSPDGRLDTKIELPVTHPTSVAFGGRDLQDLYITTARCALTDAQISEQPDAGALFRCQPGAVGLPPNTCRR